MSASCVAGHAVRGDPVVFYENAARPYDVFAAWRSGIYVMPDSLGGWAWRRVWRGSKRALRKLPPAQQREVFIKIVHPDGETCNPDIEGFLGIRIARSTGGTIGTSTG